MQVVGLSTSPRRGGNTDDAVQRVLDALAQLGGVATRFLRNADYVISPCLGCRRCMALKKCVIEDDDQAKLEDELRRADVIIVGAPVYWFGVPGPFKTFLDRTHGHYAGERFLENTIAGIITVAADSGFAETEQSVCSVLGHYGADIVGRARVFAREAGDLVASPHEIAKIDELIAKLQDRLKS